MLSPAKYLFVSRRSSYTSKTFSSCSTTREDHERHKKQKDMRKARDGSTTQGPGAFNTSNTQLRCSQAIQVADTSG